MSPKPNQDARVAGDVVPADDLEYEVLRERSAFHSYEVYRRGPIVIRETGPWATTMHSLLRHLKTVGFEASPRIVGDGFDAKGHETLTYIEGEFMQPQPWSLDGAAAVGSMLRELHHATASYIPPHDAVWGPWHSRSLGGPRPYHWTLRRGALEHRHARRHADRVDRLGFR